MQADWLWDSPATKAMMVRTRGVTSRSSWALAVALGHAHPRTTLASYCHFIHDWANHAAMSRRAKLFHGGADRNTPKAEQYPSHTSSTKDPVSPPAFCLVRSASLVKVTPSVVIQLMKYLSLGVRPSKAGWLCGMTADAIDMVMHHLGRFCSTQSVHRPGWRDEPVTAHSIMHSLIGTLPDGRWDELRRLLSRTGLPPACGSEALEQVCGPRQVLLWKDAHFLQVAAFLNAMDWYPSHFELVAAKERNSLSSDLAKRFGWRLADRHATRAEATRQPSRRIQVDPARIFVQSHAQTVEIPDRIALLVGRQHPELRERCELVLCWLAVHSALS